MKAIQNSLLTFIEKEDNVQDNYLNFDHMLDHQNIRDNQHELKSVLNMLSKISENHHRSPSFFKKIDHILHIFKNEIKKYFTNYEIFNLFQRNKEILLFLLEEDIMKIDSYVVEMMTKDELKADKFPHFFFPEIQPFLDSSLLREISQGLPENVKEARKVEYNDDDYCTMIQKDMVDEFTAYVKQNNLPLDSKIEESLFETNFFILDKKPSFIEYAAFCGSFKIFNYLYNQHVELTSSLWFYTIHGRNINILHLLEQNKIKPENDSYEECLKEAIKCHHNEIADHILADYFPKENKQSQMVLTPSLQNYNFAYIEKDQINKSLFWDLCEFDYYPLVQILLKTTNFDLNSRTIFNCILFHSILISKVSMEFIF